MFLLEVMNKKSGRPQNLTYTQEWNWVVKETRMPSNPILF